MGGPWSSKGALEPHGDEAPSGGKAEGSREREAEEMNSVMEATRN